MQNPECPNCDTKMELRHGRVGECWFCPNCGYSRLLGEFTFLCPQCNKPVKCRTHVPNHATQKGGSLCISIEIEILNDSEHEGCFDDFEYDEENQTYLL